MVYQAIKVHEEFFLPGEVIIEQGNVIAFKLQYVIFLFVCLLAMQHFYFLYMVLDDMATSK